MQFLSTWFRANGLSLCLKREFKLNVMGKTLGRIWRIFAWLVPSYKMRVAFVRLSGIKIGKGVFIGNLVMFDSEYPELIEIEDEVSIALGSIIIAHSAGSPFQARLRLVNSAPEKVILKRGCWIGAGAIILPGTTVGEASIVAAGSVVNQDVPPYTVVAGNPARPVKKLETGVTR
jgi:acetyltransferase-like isoleucine patch superfamily enzyme